MSNIRRSRYNLWVLHISASTVPKPKPFLSTQNFLIFFSKIIIKAFKNSKQFFRIYAHEYNPSLFILPIYTECFKISCNPIHNFQISYEQILWHARLAPCNSLCYQSNSPIQTLIWCNSILKSNFILIVFYN